MLDKKVHSGFSTFADEERHENGRIAEDYYSK